MTAEILSYVWGIPLPPAEKLSLLALADNYGEEPFFVSMGLRVIEEKACLRSDVALQVISALITLGFLGELTSDELYIILPEDDTTQFGWSPNQKAIPTDRGGKQYRQGYVYLLRNDAYPGIYKIGLSKNPEDRLATFEVKLPFPVEYEAIIPAPDMYALERSLHAKFQSKRVKGEWFNLSPEDVTYIKSLGGES